MRTANAHKRAQITHKTGDITEHFPTEKTAKFCGFFHCSFGSPSSPFLCLPASAARSPPPVLFNLLLRRLGCSTRAFPWRRPTPARSRWRSSDRAARGFIASAALLSPEDCCSSRGRRRPRARYRHRRHRMHVLLSRCRTLTCTTTGSIRPPPYDRQDSRSKAPRRRSTKARHPSANFRKDIEPPCSSSCSARLGWPPSANFREGLECPYSSSCSARLGWSPSANCNQASKW